MAGASGVIGQWLVKLLAAAGHGVTGTTRSPERAVARGEPGAYNIVEDSSAASNAKARVRLGWEPAVG